MLRGKIRLACETTAALVSLEREVREKFADVLVAAGKTTANSNLLLQVCTLLRFFLLNTLNSLSLIVLHLCSTYFFAKGFQFGYLHLREGNKDPRRFFSRGSSTTLSYSLFDCTAPLQSFRDKGKQVGYKKLQET